MAGSSPGIKSPKPRPTIVITTKNEPPQSEQKRGLSLSAWLPPWASKARVMVAPVLVAFLCFMFIVVHQLNNLAGGYAFLCYTSVILFFFPRGRVSQQIEQNTANFVGATIGLGWTSAVVAVAGWCGNHYGSDASEARAVLGVGLAVLSLVAGILRSWAPRLNTTCRAAMFYPIFVMTSQQTTTGFTSSVFLDPFFVALFAYAFSTIVGAIFSEHSSSPLLGSQIRKSVRITCELLPMSLTTILDGRNDSPPLSPGTGTPKPIAVAISVSGRTLEEQPVPSTWTTQQRLAKELRREVLSAISTQSAYTLDIVRARQKPQALLPVVRLLGRLQRNPILGPGGHVPGERIRTALERAYATPSRQTSRSVTPFPRSGSHISLSSMRSRSVDRGRPTSGLAHQHEHLSATLLADRLSKVATHGTHARSRLAGSQDFRSPARLKLNRTCSMLSNAIVAALSFSSEEISTACDWNRNRIDYQGPSAAELKSQLQSARNDLEKRLSGIIDTHIEATNQNLLVPDSVPATPVTPRGVVFEDEMTTADWLDDEDRFRIAFYMIALLDLAKDATRLLAYSEHLRLESTKHKRLILPTIMWPWTKVTPETPLLPPLAGEMPADDQVDERDNHEDLDFVHSVLKEEARPRAPVGQHWTTRASAAWRSIWDRRGVVFARVAISKTLHSLKHSRHVHFALKQTFGISLLSIPAFMPLGNAGRTWYDESRGPWMVVSFMYVLEVTTGATMRLGFYRMLGTFVGAVVGYVCVLIADVNPYGLVALSTACAFPISYCILFTSIAPLGIITGITLSPIVFLKYLDLAGGKSAFTIAWERFVDIAIGIAAAVFIGTWLWPIHARVQYFYAVADTMDQITEYYLHMSRDLLRPGLVYHDNSKQYTAVERAVRRQITRCRNLVDVQKQEISLLPRPIKLYSEVVDLLERLIETFTEVRALRFSLPRKATVLDVLPIRRELVSAILVNVWAVSQSFRSRSPLPQLLPSPRVPLSEVMETTDEHAHAVRNARARENLRRRWGDEQVDHDEDRDGHERHGVHAELSVLYGMAENEALGEAINSIDELLAAARTLFGSQTFLDVNEHM